MSLTMVTDRTAADVANAGQLRSKMQTGQSLTSAETAVLERGSCTVTMLNRIENAEKQIAELLNQYAYRVNIANKTWTNSMLFTYDDYHRVINNVSVLRAAFHVYAATPDVPAYMYGYAEANAIEKNLLDLDELITDMVSRFRECGTFQCGEENEQ